jgi:hypothetical protein
MSSYVCIRLEMAPDDASDLRRKILRFLKTRDVFKELRGDALEFNVTFVDAHHNERGVYIDVQASWRAPELGLCLSQSEETEEMFRLLSIDHQGTEEPELQITSYDICWTFDDNTNAFVGSPTCSFSKPERPFSTTFKPKSINSQSKD